MDWISDAGKKNYEAVVASFGRIRILKLIVHAKDNTVKRGRSELHAVYVCETRSIRRSRGSLVPFVW